jgi:hypothetical protein
MTARVADVDLEKQFVPVAWRAAANLEAARGYEMVWMVDPDPDPVTGVAPGLVSGSLINTWDSTYAEVAIVKVDPADSSTWTMAAPIETWLPCDDPDND